MFALGILLISTVRSSAAPIYARVSGIPGDRLTLILLLLLAFCVITGVQAVGDVLSFLQCSYRADLYVDF